MKTSLPSKSKREGFTLVEITLTIAVIGVLAALAITALRDDLSASRDAKARSNAQTIAQMYCAALSAGVVFTPAQTADLPAVIATLESGVSPSSGSLAGQMFKISALSPGEELAAGNHLDYAVASGVLTYRGGNDL